MRGISTLVPVSSHLLQEAFVSSGAPHESLQRVTSASAPRLTCPSGGERPLEFGVRQLIWNLLSRHVAHGLWAIDS